MNTIKNIMNGLTAWFLRTPIVNGFRDAIAKAIDDILDLFYLFRTALRWKLFHSSQIISLEHYLNDHFAIPYSVATRDADIIAGNIIWVESQNFVPFYLYNKIESRPKHYIYNKSEYPLTPPSVKTYLRQYSELLDSSSFIVWIPVAVVYDDAIVRSLIDFFKLAGKTYSIQTY